MSTKREVKKQEESKMLWIVEKALPHGRWEEWDEFSSKFDEARARDLFTIHYADDQGTFRLVRRILTDTIIATS